MTRLLIPPAPALIAHVAFFGLFRVVLGGLWVEPFFAFFLVGYLAYDYCISPCIGRHCRRGRAAPEATAHAPSLRDARGPLGR